MKAKNTTPSEQLQNSQKKVIEKASKSIKNSQIVVGKPCFCQVHVYVVYENMCSIWDNGNYFILPLESGLTHIFFLSVPIYITDRIIIMLSSIIA